MWLIGVANGGMFAKPIALRTDFDADTCRLAAKRSKDSPQARRLLALTAIYEGASRGEAARIGGVTVQIVRDWVVKFNAHGPAGLNTSSAGPIPQAIGETAGFLSRIRSATAIKAPPNVLDRTRAERTPARTASRAQCMREAGPACRCRIPVGRTDEIRRTLNSVPAAP